MRVLKTVPASAFCEKATQTDAVASTVDVMASGLKRSISERLEALEKKSAANDAKMAANREEIERLKTWLDDWRNTNILITRFREMSRNVMAFFNAIYATWVRNHPRPEKYGGAAFLDKAECPLNEDCAQDEKSGRHRRALDFLRDMWTGFGGVDMDVGTWNGLRAFIKNTNTACHAVPKIEPGNTVESIVARERAAPPRLDREATSKMLNTIMPLLSEFGKGNWSAKKPGAANAKALANRSRFKKFPERWPRTA